jgi:hypothetical protein
MGEGRHGDILVAERLAVVVVGPVTRFIPGNDHV